MFGRDTRFPVGKGEEEHKGLSGKLVSEGSDEPCTGEQLVATRKLEFVGPAAQAVIKSSLL